MSIETIVIWVSGFDLIEGKNLVVRIDTMLLSGVVSFLSKLNLDVLWYFFDLKGLNVLKLYSYYWDFRIF